MLSLQVLWLSDCLAIYRSVYYLGHISIIAIMLVGVAFPPRKPKKEAVPEQAVAAAAAMPGDGAEAAAAVGSLDGKKAQ